MNKELLIKKALERGIQEIEIFQEIGESTTISLFNGQIDKFTVADSNTLAIRAIYNNKMSYLSTENSSDSQIDFIIDELKKSANVIDSLQVETLHDGSGNYQKVEQMVSENEYDSKYKIDLLKNLNQAILNYDARIQPLSSVSYTEYAIKVSILNSKGVNLNKSRTVSYFIAQAVAKEENDTKSGFEFEVVKDLKNFDVNTLAKNVCDACLDALGAKMISTGSYPTILKNTIASQILSAFFPIFSGTTAMMNMTKLRGKENTKVFGENINIIDDPFDTRAVIQHPFDDEGVACYKKSIVENGVFKGLLHSIKTASYFKEKSTGNGFKLNAASQINVKNSNMYIQTGNVKIEDMKVSIEDGVYITSVAGTHSGINTISGDFNLQASGFKIEKGQIAYPITLLVISGNIYDMLNNVEMIGDTLRYDTQSIASPDLKIKTMQISSK